MSNFDVEKWMKEVKHEIDVNLESPIGESPCIFSASTALLREYEHAYVPQMVSIGPYHFGKEHLRGMETFKADAVGRELLRSQIKAGDSVSACSFNQVVERIKSMEGEIRRCYDKELPYDSEVLGWMMARDASFILEFLRCLLWESVGDYERFNEDGDSQILQMFHPIFGSKSNPVVRAYIMKDLIKLENQIPLFVLEQVLSIQTGDHDLQKAKSKLQVLLKAVFDKICYRPFEFLADTSKAPRQCHSNHILHMYYYHCVGYVTSLKAERVMEIQRSNKVPSAVDLKNGGVKIQASGKEIENVSFVDRTLSIPRIELCVDSEIFLRNLIAFEISCPDGSLGRITAFLQFMNELCQTEKGAAVMRDSGVIGGSLWQHSEVARFFSSCKQSGLILPSDHPIEVTRTKLMNYYSKKSRIIGKWNELWNEFRNTYGSRPWLLVGGMTAATVLALTAIQVHCLYHHCGPP